MRAVMTLAELQTTADEVSPDDDRHNDNSVHEENPRMDAVLRYNRGLLHTINIVYGWAAIVV